MAATCAARRGVGQQRGHATGRHGVDDRRNHTCPCGPRRRYERGRRIGREVAVDGDRGGIVSRVPEGRHLAQHPSVGGERALRIGQRPVRRPRVDRDVDEGRRRRRVVADQHRPGRGRSQHQHAGAQCDASSSMREWRAGCRRGGRSASQPCAGRVAPARRRCAGWRSLGTRRRWPTAPPWVSPPARRNLEARPTGRAPRQGMARGAVCRGEPRHRRLSPRTNRAEVRRRLRRPAGATTW